MEAQEVVKKFFRWTNISRIIGIILVIVGKFFPAGVVLQAGQYSVSGVNSLEIAGLALIFLPAVLEIYRRKSNPTP